MVGLYRDKKTLYNIDMDTFEDTKYINLCSSNATLLNGSQLSNVFFNFRGLLDDEPNILQSYIEVVDCQFPVSFYGITALNNTITASYNGGSAFNFTIPVGNYNAVSLASTLQSLFSNNITVSFNITTGLLLFSSTNTFTIFNSSSYPILGFNPSSNYTATLTSGTYYITPPFPCSVIGTKKLKICSEYLAGNSIDSYTGGTCNILQTIPVSSPPYGLILFQSQASRKSLLRNKVINMIDIQILDENNNFINFQNVEWTITLALTMMKVYIPESETTFNDITEPILKIQADKKHENEKPIFDEGNDLDFFLWNFGIDQ